jgi:hypothetical protein
LPDFWQVERVNARGHPFGAHRLALSPQSIFKIICPL